MEVKINIGIGNESIQDTLFIPCLTSIEPIIFRSDAVDRKWNGERPHRSRDFKVWVPVWVPVWAHPGGLGWG